MHIFAISGLHIALIAGILVALLRGLRVPRQWCGLIVIPLIWFYTGATGWQSSAIRSTLMMTLIVGGWSLHRPTDLLNSLAAAALMILVWEPQQLFQASFQLSFFVVLSIALLTPPLQRQVDKLLAHDPLLPREALPRWRRWLETPARWFALSFSTSLAAWLGSLPLTLFYFHLFSPVTLLANLIVVPMSSASLASAMGSLVCGGWLPWAGELFNHSAWFWMKGMVWVSEQSVNLPGAFWYAPAPALADFVIYYALLVLVLSGVFYRPGRRRWLVLTLLAVATFYGWRWLDARREIQITVLPLNGGHAIHVNGPGQSHDWLVDCGNTNAVKFVTKPFLQAKGVNRLPRLALTHGDLQHIGGTILLQDKMPIEKNFTSPARFRSAAYRAITESLTSATNRHGILRRGDTNGCWTVLHPDEADKFSQADDASLVLLGQFHGTRILLLGDLGRPGQEALMNRTTNLQADIVITGLPEQGEALCDRLIEQVQPKVIIVADSEFPATKRARPPFLERLARHNAHVLSTRNTGAVTLLINHDNWIALPVQGPDFNSSE